MIKLIGGSWDGTWHNGASAVFTRPKRMLLQGDAVIMVGLNTFPIAVGKDDDIYHLESLHTQEEMFHFYRHSSLTVECCLGLLLELYSGEK